MHVLVIPSWYENETTPTLGSFFREQAEGLAKNGVKVTIAYPGFNSLKTFGKNSNGLNKYIKNNICVYRYDTYNYLFDKFPIDIKSRLFKKKLFSLYKRIEEERGKPDIIHIHSAILAGYGGVCLGKKYDIPVVITEHSSAFLQHKFKKDNIKLIRYSFDNSDCLVAVSNGLKENMLRYISNTKVEVIPNIIDVNKFNILNYEKHNGRFTFITVCYLNNNKGLDTLLNAFSQAYKGNPKVELVICGDGNEKKKLINLTNKLGIQQQVKFLGAVTREEVNVEMNKANCFVLPSRFETFGVVLIEALACGLPVISTKTCGPKDIVNDSNGILVDIDNVTQLANAMVKIRKCGEKYSREYLRENCEKKYSEPIVIRNIKMLFEEVIEKRGNRCE